jgi:hypothetical protein
MNILPPDAVSLLKRCKKDVRSKWTDPTPFADFGFKARFVPTTRGRI